MAHSDGNAQLDAYFTEKERAAIRALGARDLDELVRTPPRRYSAPGPLRSMRSLIEGDDISVIATVVSAHARRMKNRPGTLLDVRIMDDDGESLNLTFFLFKEHLASWHMSRLTEGVRVLVSGTVNYYREQPQIAHPEYLILSGHEDSETETSIAEALRPKAIYPLRNKVTQKFMQQLFQKALEHVSEVSESIPAAVREERKLTSAREAVLMLHRPHDLGDVAVAQRYFRFEEAFIIQSVFARRRAQDARDPAPSLGMYGPLSEGLDARLPFELTPSQIAIGKELAERVSARHPSSVLLQGDVGSGKTVVALRAMARAVDSGYQAALLAPTDVLARQHYATILQMLGDLGSKGQLDSDPHATSVRLLVGSQKVNERREALLDLMSGEAGIVVGTHALLTESVEFFNLGLVIVDEQHRFGVDHRRQLRAKGREGERPHLIAMTATPIPRSAALSLVGDLDLLVLEQRQRAGAQVRGFVVPLQDRTWSERMWQRTREEVASGRQAFVVCARIDSGDEDSFADAAQDPPRSIHTVVDTAEALRGRPDFEGVSIECLHGRMSAEEKKRVMERFASGELDVLVATTVIEVGVDVPNASVMIVLDAERFGLAQLHQLRGRIGRGDHAGIAFFATDFARGTEPYAHLEELATTTDGFALAELDLARRGSGDLVGEVQSGTGISVRFLDVQRDSHLIADAREDAFVVEALRRGSLTGSSITEHVQAEWDALDRAVNAVARGGAESLERS